MPLFILSKHLGRTWLDHVIGARLNARKCQPAFQGVCTILPSHQPGMRVLLLHNLPNTGYIFWILAILVIFWWSLIVIWICMPLLTNEIKRFFMGLFTIYISSYLKCVFKPLTHIFIGLLLNVLEFKNSLYNLNMGLCEIHDSQILSLSLWLAFSFS